MGALHERIAERLSASSGRVAAWHIDAHLADGGAAGAIRLPYLVAAAVGILAGAAIFAVMLI